MSILLLVDTDPLSLRVLAVSLRRAGNIVIAATDAESALAQLGRAKPDLLVTDARLRDNEALALVKSVRAKDGDAPVPVILLSGADSTVHSELSRNLGADDVMTRPVHVRELIARVALLLARRAASTFAGGSPPSSDARLHPGTTDDLALVDLLQVLESSRTTGVVHLQEETSSTPQDARIEVRDLQQARIFVRDGNVVDAELGRLRGADVVHRALGWERASFRVEHGPVDNDDLFECTTHALLLRAMDRLEGHSPAGELERITPVVEPEPDGCPERNVPSTAPWTREAAPDEALTGEVDLVAAGVPHSRHRTLRRVGLLVAGATAVTALVLGLGSVRARQVRDAAAARGAATGPTSAAVAMAAADPTVPAVLPAEAPVADGLVPDTGEATPVLEGVAGEATHGTPDNGALLSAGSAAPIILPAIDPRETALNVRSEMHARSPLVRDAERALLKGDTTTALTLAQKAVAANSGDADAWLTLAAARKASGDLAGARDAYGKCVASAHTFSVMSCRALASAPQSK